MTYKQWANIWLDKYVKHLTRQSTYFKYQRIVDRYLVPALGEYDLDELKPHVLQDFAIHALEQQNMINGQPLATNTIGSIVAVLKNSLKQAVKAQIADREYTTSITLPPRPEKPIDAFTKAEQRLIEGYCYGHIRKNYIGIVICLYTGLRIGELLALTWDDIDFQKRTITINKTTSTIWHRSKKYILTTPPKTKLSTRTIPIPRQLSYRLRKMKGRGKSTNFVISTRNNTQVETRSYQRSFARIQEVLQIPYRNFHALRHTFATRALEMGMDVKTVSEIMGHSNTSMTLQRYAHSMMDYKKEMMNRLGRDLIPLLQTDKFTPISRQLRLRRKTTTCMKFKKKNKPKKIAC